MSMPSPALPPSLLANRRLSLWLGLHADGSVSVRSGKVELGQGIATALAQIVAGELDVAPARVRMQPASTASSPDEGVTSGSLSVQQSGSALRQACAEARAIYLEAAATRLGVAVDSLRVVDGVIRSTRSEAATSYWELAAPSLLECDATGRTEPKPAGAQDGPLQRLDLPDKVAGRPRFIHDIGLPGMLYGRVARPPSPAAQLLDVDVAAVQALPGVVAVVRSGSFLGVVAEGEYLAVKALSKLAGGARWSETASLPDRDALPEFLRSQPVETSLIAERKAADASAPTRTFKAAYSRPYLAHASIGPSCAIARVNPGSVEVWSHSQGIFPLRADIAKVLRVPVESVTVRHAEGAGCYGHNGADDAALDAVLLAQAVPGRAVQVLWTRQDELAWSPFGAAMAVDLQAGVDASGRIVAWRHEVWSNGHSTRPGRPGAAPATLLAAQHLPGEREPLLGIDVPLANGGGSQRNADPFYNFAEASAVTHRLRTMPLRVSSLRSLGAHCNVFAAESFIDEIAIALDADPLEYRLRHLDDARARAVLETAALMSGWGTRSRGEGRGHGIAFARYKNAGAYCAVVARVEAGRELRVEQLWIAVDVGRVVNLDGVLNQVEGGAIQTVSWVLKEAVRFDRTRVESDSWEAYPILRFTDVPLVDVRVLERAGEKSLGAGEATHGPVSAAIANALADALGLRVRHLPLTAEAITRAALAA